MEQKIHFKELQSFTQWWLWLIIFSPILLIFINIISTIISLFSGYSPYESGNVSISWISGGISILQVVFLVIYILTILFLALSKLRIVVTNNEITIRHLLFFKKVIRLNDIVNKEMVNYKFVGYGIRLTKKYGTVFNVKGTEGIFLTLTDGNKYLIGTQRPTELFKSISNNC